MVVTAINLGIIGIQMRMQTVIVNQRHNVYPWFKFAIALVKLNIHRF